MHCTQIFSPILLSVGISKHFYLFHHSFFDFFLISCKTTINTNGGRRVNHKQPITDTNIGHFKMVQIGVGACAKFN